MKQYSAKRSKQIYKYKAIRYEYLHMHPLCGRCGGMASEIHHRKGRSGEMLNDTKFFMPVCRDCHNWIESNPTKAKENGYSISRL